MCICICICICIIIYICMYVYTHFFFFSFFAFLYLHIYRELVQVPSGPTQRLANTMQVAEALNRAGWPVEPLNRAVKISMGGLISQENHWEILGDLVKHLGIQWIVAKSESPVEGRGKHPFISKGFPHLCKCLQEGI